MVGNAATVEVMGTPFCGKGEPSQVIRVGHASPACKFHRTSDVFGAARGMRSRSARRMNSRCYTEAAHFEALADALLRADPAVDRTSLYLRAEASDFLRFNKAALRQATSVQQAYVTIAVERGQRRAESTLTLSGDAGARRAAAAGRAQRCWSASST